MIQHCGMFGGTEIILILVVVALLFGAKKIPELAKGLGKGVREFKDATEKSDLAKDLKDVASEVNKVKKDVEKLDPKKMLKIDNPVSTKKK